MTSIPIPDSKGPLVRFISSTSEQGTQFGGSGDSLFGYLHLPMIPAVDAATNVLGVVLCSPFGYESICSHRALRSCAQQFAMAGMPTLRFDYHGTGDSAGDDLQPRRVEAWLASIAAAILHLRTTANVQQVALVGIRLGALLAMTLASHRSDIAAVVAIAPVANGKAYVRELKILQAALHLAKPPQASEHREALGFALTEQTVASLVAIDATKLPLIAPALFIIDRTDFADSKSLYAKQQLLAIAAGGQVDRQAIDGYTEMMMDPHKMLVPVAMINAATIWLQARTGKVGCATMAMPLRPSFVAIDAGDPIDSNDHTLLTGESQSQQSSRRIDSHGPLNAVMTTPAVSGVSPSSAAMAARCDHAVLMLNAGAVHHVGPNRLYVRLARRLAAQGVASMRIDLAGIGDSSALSASDENIVYMPKAVADIRAVVRSLQLIYRRISVLGLCSGAYHAFKAAAAGEKFEHVVMINPLVYFWHDGMSLDNVESHVVADAQQYADSFRSVEKWKKLLRGDVNVRYVAHVVVERGLQRAKFQARDLARHIGIKIGTDDLGFDIQQMVDRGTKLHWIFADSDPGRSLLHEQGGAVVTKLLRRGQLSVDTINGADHTFTAMWTHPVLLACIMQRLELRP